MIRALNADMSFREFTIEQIAGDMLPKPTKEQLVATGFNRNSMLNQEGGIDINEYYWYSQVDRVNTTASVWLGLDSGCAQCHNHKFDPFPAERLLSFPGVFRSLEAPAVAGPGRPLDGRTRTGIAEPGTSRTKSKEIRAQMTRLQSALDTQTPELDRTQKILGSGRCEERESQWSALRAGSVLNPPAAQRSKLAAGQLHSRDRKKSAGRYLHHPTENGSKLHRSRRSVGSLTG